MALLKILPFAFLLLGFSAHAEPEAAKIQPLNLEIGLGLGYGRGVGGLPTSSERALFSAIFGYHWPRWMIGITTRGAFSTAGQTYLQSSQALDQGNLTHRSIEYGLVARRYLDDQSYAQFAFGFDYNEAIAGDQNISPNLTKYLDRFYLDGTWFQIACGHEFKESPWFMRVEYTYTFYYRANIIGTQAGVNRVIEDRVLLSNPKEHILSFVIGLANIF